MQSTEILLNRIGYLQGHEQYITPPLYSSPNDLKMTEVIRSRRRACAGCNKQGHCLPEERPARHIRDSWSLVVSGKETGKPGCLIGNGANQLIIELSTPVRGRPLPPSASGILPFR